jgi:WD40 repeat protein
VAAAPAGGSDRAVRIWRRPDWSPLTLAVTAGRTARHLSWDDSGRYLLVVDDANRVAIYKLPDTKPVYDQVLDPDSEGTITAADLSPDGDWFVLAAEKIRVRSWRLPFLSAPLAAWGRVNAVFFAGGVEALVTYDETGAAIRWLLNNGNVQAGGSAQLGTAAAWGFDSGGRVLALLDSSGVAGGWRTEDLTGLEAIATPLCPTVGR